MRHPSAVVLIIVQIVQHLLFVFTANYCSALASLTVSLFFRILEFDESLSRDCMLILILDCGAILKLSFLLKSLVFEKLLL